MFAREKKGADLIIQKIDGTEVRGELIAVKQNSLLLLDRFSGADVTIDIEGIGTIKIVKKTNLLAGAGLGLIIGGGIGGLVGFAGGDVESPPFYFTAADMAAFWAFIAGIEGVIIGVIVSALKGKDKTIPFIGKSDSEIQEIFEKLRKKARVKNAQ